MTGAIKPPLRSIAPAGLLAQARANCAARLAAGGHDVEAQCFERGDRDDAWAMKHEVAKLRAEASASDRALTPQTEAHATGAVQAV